MVKSRISVSFLLAHMKMGGAEVAVANWLAALPQDTLKLSLILRTRSGALLERVPKSVIVRDLGGKRSALAGPRLRAVVAGLNTDVLYSATSAMNILALRSFGASGPAVLASEHSSPLQYLAEAKMPALRRFMTRRYYPRAAGILTPTNEIRDELAGLLMPHRVPISCLPNPILSGQSPQRVREPGLIVTAGRLVEAKGHDVLLKAMTLPALSEARLRVFGDGPQRDSLQTMAASLGLGDRVEFRGNTDQLVSEIAKADCFALPSRREGFGNVVVEALHAGVPVVASDLPGPRKLLADGAFGALVPVGDAQALAQAVATAFGTSPDAAALASVAPFTIQASSAQLLSHIHAAAN